jgi:hypothetical protein
VSPVRYELGFYIPEDGIFHSHCNENLKSYIAFWDAFAEVSIKNGFWDFVPCSTSSNRVSRSAHSPRYKVIQDIFLFEYHIYSLSTDTDADM